MKIRKVSHNNRKSQLDIVSYSGRSLPFPYPKLDPRPSSDNKIVEAYVDLELAKEGVTYVLESGDEGSVHIDHVLEYNEDPAHLRELLIYKLTVAAKGRVEESGLSRRELARRLSTSVPQLYRLLDTTNTKKSMNQLISLLHLLECDVDVVIRDRASSAA